MKKLLDILVRLETTAKNNNNLHKAIDIIDAEFNDFDVVTRKYMYNSIPSLVVTTSTEKNPKILLQGHIDVIEATKDSFIPKYEGSRMYGRGTSDMKGVLVAMIEAYKEIIKRDPTSDIGLMITADEEQGGANGVGPLLQKEGFSTEVVFIPDGMRGDWSICTEEKGLIWFECSAKGKSAHASRKWHGESAIELLIEFLTDLKSSFESQYGIPNEQNDWIPTLNIGKIDGGEAYNSVSLNANAGIDIRFPAPFTPADFKSFLSKIAKKHSIKVTPSVQGFPTKIEQSNVYLKNLETVFTDMFNKKPELYKTHGASDGRFFGERSIPIVSIKPTASEIHQEEEWIDVKELEIFRDLIVAWIKKSLN